MNIFREHCQAFVLLTSSPLSSLSLHHLFANIYCSLAECLGGGGVKGPVGGRGSGACACLVLGLFLGVVTDGEWGRDIYGQELVRQVTKGTNAPHPATISRPGKVTWRAWPAITLRSQWSSQAIAILHLVLVAAVLCRILGLNGRWGEGAVFPSLPAASSH
jgi:hypothetical protein